MQFTYRINPALANDELNELFSNAWETQQTTDFRPILERSLAFVGVYYSELLIGFVNLAWDGGVHAFVLDTTVHKDFQRRGIGRQLIEEAAREAKNRGVEWLHVDFEPHLQTFYDRCGFRNTSAGLRNLKLENG